MVAEAACAGCQALSHEDFVVVEVLPTARGSPWSFSTRVLTPCLTPLGFQVPHPAALSGRVTVHLPLTTSDLIGHTRSKMTFLSITVSLVSLQLNKGCRTNRLFKESQHSDLTS